LVRSPAGRRPRRDPVQWTPSSAGPGSTGFTPRAIREAIVRNYTKWDDQPASPAAAREALIRATWIADNGAQGPVYINLDAEMQEARLAEPLAPIEAARFMPLAIPRRPPNTSRPRRRSSRPRTTPSS